MRSRCHLMETTLTSWMKKTRPGPTSREGARRALVDPRSLLTNDSTFPPIPKEIAARRRRLRQSLSKTRQHFEYYSVGARGRVRRLPGA